MQTKNNYIILLGGGLSNKGAQAMTFTVVDQLKRIFPDKEIYLFSTLDFEREYAAKKIYNFNFLPWTSKSRIKLLLGPFVKDSTKHAHKLKDIKTVLNNTSFIVDISGYALSSKWGFSASIAYLINILIAKRYSIPFYIFPQSFGPFDYPLMQKLILFPLFKLCLRYPRKTFIREQQSLKYVRRFVKSGLEQSSDIVLQNTGYDLSKIYSLEVPFKSFSIASNSAAVIPNMRVADTVEQEKLDEIYRSLIESLQTSHTVYIIRHSNEDLEICRRLKSLFTDNSKVILIEDELNAVELEKMLEQFEFVIASRYHSIIHSYKNGVPAIVIGWAQKYAELLRDFDQSEYYFDCRNDIDIDDIIDKLNRMIRNFTNEKEMIVRRMNSMPEKNIFDILQEDVTGHAKNPR